MEVMKLFAFKYCILDRYATAGCVAAGSQLAELCSATVLSKGHASGISIRLVPSHKVCSVSTKMCSARSVVLSELTKLQQRQKITQFIYCNQCLCSSRLL